MRIAFFTPFQIISLTNAVERPITYFVYSSGSAVQANEAINDTINTFDGLRAESVLFLNDAWEGILQYQTFLANGKGAMYCLLLTNFKFISSLSAAPACDCSSDYLCSAPGAFGTEAKATTELSQK